MHRRTFLSVTAGMALVDVSAPAAAAATSVPIIDTHIHLFDPRRPQGVPWPAKDDKVLYHPALPDRYRKVIASLGVTGAIEVECSPWLEDNQWVLDIAAKDTMIVGMVGNLEPSKPDFRKQLDRFHRNPLFLGIRYGDLWDRSLHAELAKPEFISGLKAMADAGLEMDTYLPDPARMQDLVRLTDQVPNLRLVIDHLPQLNPPTAPAALASYLAGLRELGKRPQVYVKVSEVLRRVDGRVPVDLNFYRERLDQIWEIFGQDRLIYGSDWPNSDVWLPYQHELNVVREYFTSKGPAAAEKYFWKNSIAAYRWVKRDPGQPQLKA